MFRVRVDQDFVAVEFRAGDVVVDMCEVGLARRQLGRAFQVQKAGQDAAVTAGIQNEFSGQFIIFACIGRNAQTCHIAAVVKRGYAVSEADIDTLFCRFINQDFVEDAAAHLINGAGAV